MLLTTHVLLVFTDSGAAKKDRLVEQVPLDTVADALLQVDPKVGTARSRFSLCSCPTFRKWRCA